jgi:hypothetical protein
MCSTIAAWRFTDDCLLAKGNRWTDFQEGDPSAMYRSVCQRIFSVPDSCVPYPALDFPG